jgi:predicted  nucleic acid-binding Zn-ribbon protein
MSQRAFLYNLQTIDNQIDKILDRITSIDKKISFNQEIVDSEKELKSIQASLDTKKREIGETESQSNLLSKKLKQNNDAMYAGKIKNPKELQSVEEESASLQKRIKVFDDKIFELMLESETIENQLMTHTQKHQQRLATKEREDQNLLLERHSVMEALEKLKIEKNPIEKQIKAELLQKYALLRETRNKLAVATVSEEACSACGNMITPAEIQKIKSPIDEYYCQICKRFLYHG